MDGSPFPDIDAAPVFKAVQAELEAIPALIALWGFSDSGKTYSALRLARGMVGPKGKIVLIDTENRRAKLYAGLFGGWYHIDMQPPFTPQRYSAAYAAARNAGADVIVVDSQSHVWEGEGGVLDQADASSSKGLAKWKTPKTAYKRMTNELFRAPVHMIFCVRAKEKFVQHGTGKDAQILSAGPTPICDSRFIYEMTVSVHLESGSHLPLDPVKAPEAIAHAIRSGAFITEECGATIATWLASGVPVDHEALELQSAARAKAAEGTEALRAWWGSTVTKGSRKKLEPIIAELQATADQADAEIMEARRRIADARTGDPLDDPFTTKTPVSKTESTGGPSLSHEASNPARPDATDPPAPAPGGPVVEVEPFDPKASPAEIRRWAKVLKDRIASAPSSEAIAIGEHPNVKALADTAPKTLDEINAAINQRLDTLAAAVDA